MSSCILSEDNAFDCHTIIMVLGQWTIIKAASVHSFREVWTIYVEQLIEYLSSSWYRYLSPFFVKFKKDEVIILVKVSVLIYF
jgi:hypothetical protein